MIGQFGEGNVVRMSAAVPLGERCVTSKKRLRGRLIQGWTIRKVIGGVGGAEIEKKNFRQEIVIKENIFLRSLAKKNYP